MLHIKKIFIIAFVQKTDMSDSKFFIALAQNEEKFFKLDFSVGTFRKQKLAPPPCSFAFVFF